MYIEGRVKICKTVSITLDNVIQQFVGHKGIFQGLLYFLVGVHLSIRAFFQFCWPQFRIEFYEISNTFLRSIVKLDLLFKRGFETRVLAKKDKIHTL